MITRARLKHLTWAELGWRAAAGARTARDRWRYRVRPERWRRSDLADVLSSDAPDHLRAALDRRDWRAADDALALVLRDSVAPLLPREATPEAMRAAVLARWPDAAYTATVRADALVAGRFDLLAYHDVACRGTDGRIDWFSDPIHARRPSAGFAQDVRYLDPSNGDHKVIWELNRHQHLLALGRAAWLSGDRRYMSVAVSDAADWMRANPPLHGVNWSSMLELGFRTLSWVWALRLADDLPPMPDDETPWRVDLLLGIARQCRQIRQQLSYYFSPNTHLTGEALALYVVGRLCPVLRDADAWARTGRAVLLRESHRQVLADGGHAERSTHYHRYTLDFYLQAWLVASRSGDPAAPRFLQIVERLARAARALANDEGLMPTIGDDDGGRLWPFLDRDPADVRDSLTLAALALDAPELAPWGPQEEACWVWGPDAIARTASWPRRSPAPMPSVRLAQTGYAVLRGERGHLVFDVGPHGYLNGGHAHADALALTLDVDSRRLLIDPGTATYTTDPALRDRFRRSQQHNTVTVDGHGPSMPAGPFHWRTRTDAVAGDWRTAARVTWASGWHDGYRQLRHARSVLHGSGSGWLIVDWLDAIDRNGGRVADAPNHAATTAVGWHELAVHWHLDPTWSLAPVATGRLRATHPDGLAVWLLHDGDTEQTFRGDAATGLGWCSPRYGDVGPTWTLRSLSRITLPGVRASWFGPADEWTDPVLRRLASPADAVAVRVSSTGRTLDAIVRRPEPSPSPTGRPAPAALLPELCSDAALLHRLDDGDGLQVTAFDLTLLASLDPRIPSVRLTRPLAELTLEASGPAVMLWSSAPPAELEVDAPEAGRVLLNGREAPRRSASGPLHVTAADWGNAVPTRNSPCAA